MAAHGTALEVREVSLTFGSLFSGIGGIELGLERAGFKQHRWYSEIDPYCIRVHEKHWPDVPNLGDVREVDWSTVERVDLICGGYPCQPFSFAGNRDGSEDERHLWPFMRDAVRVLRPRFVLIENVPGHLSLGFDRVLADLASLGFDASWSIVSACALGAPHARERLFCVAHSTRSDEPHQVPRHRIEAGDDADPDARLAGIRWLEPRGGRSAAWRDWWVSEPPLDRVAHGLPIRLVRDSLAAYGNAVVPQVAEFIGTQLLQAIGAPR